MMFIVPDSLRDAINAKLDAAYEKVPEAAEGREEHYGVLLAYFNKHGRLPDFQLQRRDAT